MNFQTNRIQLSDIIKQKKVDLLREMGSKPIDILKENVYALKEAHFDLKKNNSFKYSIYHENDVDVICEFKQASPSMGYISNLYLEDALTVFEQSGASAVSILTEEKYFNGSLENLRSASNTTKLPIIRKDFIIHEYQLYQAKISGANAVLLICGVYPKLEDGISLCSELGLDAVVECRNKEDISSAVKAGADIVGINNRNLQDFKVDLKTTEKLAGNVPQEIVLVSESGIQSPKDALKLSKSGIDALLIGTSIMSAKGMDGMLNVATSIIGAMKGVKVDRNEG
jgi:indole-3-glycerol phosphate synthase